MARALWIPERCRAFGLKVVEVDGWQARGKEPFNPRGVVCHHTADGPGEIPSLRVLINGRSDLPGPLCQVGLARSGAVYVVASGRANHAGRGGWKGLSGNSSVLGIEAENRGGAGDPWPLAQLDAYVALAAALISGPGVGGNVELVCGHKEWAPGRKPDPHSIDMSDFRTLVRSVLTGQGQEVGAVFIKIKSSIYQVCGDRLVKIGRGSVGSDRWDALEAAGAKLITGAKATAIANEYGLAA